MKNIFFILAITLFCNCGAQSPVLSLFNDTRGGVSGAYYKDNYNEFDKFVGTWKYQVGNKSLTITIQKKTLYYNENDDTYIDMLIGEYKYINENGVIVVNTLPNLNLTILKPFENNIAGTLILDRTLIPALRRVQLNFIDPERDYLNRSIILKHAPAQGSVPAKIEIHFMGDTSTVPSENSPTEIRVPEQDYILIKQP